METIRQSTLQLPDLRQVTMKFQSEKPTHVHLVSDPGLRVPELTFDDSGQHGQPGMLDVSGSQYTLINGEKFTGQINR